jgi:uncharacterized membrane protein YgdD (TMEM256/DUF423 family)
MQARFWLAAGSLLAALDVALAAYGAHGLKETLERLVPESPVAARPAADAQGMAGTEGDHMASDVTRPQRSRNDEIAYRLGIFDTAARYQMYHSLGLIALGLLMTRQRSAWFSAAGWLFLGGVAIFSGLLYALVFSGPTILGAIVPIGGLAMIIGWIALAAGAWRAGTQFRPPSAG